MRKELLKKIFIALLFLILFNTIIISNNVKATNTENLETQENEINNDEEESKLKEEKIMKYDAKTGEITEVNIEELRQISTTLSNNGKEKMINTAQCNTEISKQLPSNSSIMPLADSWVEIKYTRDFPNKPVCRLKWKQDSLATGHGSGSLVGKNLLLTAAHCVFDKDTKEPYANWVAQPGYSAGVLDGLSCGWSYVYYSNGWMDDTKDEYDWAICVLEQNLGEQAGYFEVQSYGSTSDMNNLLVECMGYPIINPGANDPTPYQYFTAGTISWPATNHFRFSGKTAQGMSGGPVARASDHFIVGVYKGQYNIGNARYGVRMTSEHVSLIVKLRQG